jgi:hypothetical protein
MALILAFCARLGPFAAFIHESPIAHHNFKEHAPERPAFPQYHFSTGMQIVLFNHFRRRLARLRDEIINRQGAADLGAIGLVAHGKGELVLVGGFRRRDADGGGRDDRAPKKLLMIRVAGHHCS